MLFALLAGGVSPAWAQKTILSEGFENGIGSWTTASTASSTGIITDAKNSGSYGFSFSYNSNPPQYLISPELSIPANATDINLSLYYRAYSGTYEETFQIGYSTTTNETTAFTWDTEISTSETKTTWTEYTNTTLPLGTKYIAVRYNSNDKYRLYVDDILLTCVVSGPDMAVLDGTSPISSGYNYKFGLTTGGQAKTFTLKNTGTEACPVSVNHTGSYGVALSATSIPANGEVTLTVTMPNTVGENSDVITISSTANGIADFVINVSGTVRDPSKLWCNFSEGLPSGWTNSGNWTITTSGADGTTTGGGYAYNTSYGTNKLMYTPLVTIADGEKLYLQIKGYGSTASWNKLNIQYSADGTNWTNAKVLESITNTWQSLEVTEIPAGNWYIGFYGSYVYFTDIYGGTESTAPIIALSQASYDFGLISSNTTSPSVTITNTGKSALTGLNITSNNANFTVNCEATEIAANGGTATFTVTMAPNATGAQTATITVKSSNADDLTFTATGAVAKPGTTTAVFNDETLAGWTKAGNTSFNSDETAAYFYYSPSTLTSPKVKIVADDFLAIDAKMASSYGYVTVQGSADGSSWTDIKKLDSSVLNETGYTTAIVSGISTDYKYLRLNGYYCYVKQVAGLTYTAELVVKDSEDAVQSSPVAYDFGKQRADATVTYSFTNASSVGTIYVTNVAITGDGAAAYFTNWTESVPVPFDLKITRTYAERVGAQNAVVTVTTSEGDFVINVTGSDIVPVSTFPWSEDFNSLTSGIPEDWNNSEGTTTSDSYKWNYYATGHDGACVRFNSYYNGEGNTNFLKTPMMNLPAGKDMQLSFWYKNPAGGDFSVYISNDGGDTYETALATGLTGATDWTEKIVDIPDGFVNNVVIVFKGTSNYADGDAYIYLDDVAVEEKVSGAKFSITPAVTGDQDFGSVRFGSTAEKTYTVTNNGDADLFVKLTGDENFTTTGNTMLFTNTKGWSSVKVHAWNGEGNLTVWPGIDAPYYGKNSNNEDQYAIVVPDGATGIVINNGNGLQSSDITNFNVEGYYLSGDLYDNNKYWAASWGENRTVLTVAAGGSENFTISMNTATSGDKSGNVELTLNAVNATSLTIPCIGEVKDENYFFVDFEDGQFPTGWQVGADWSIGTAGGNKYAVQSNAKTASAIVTTPLTVAENETLTFKAARNNSGTGITTSLKTRYSTDGGATWSDYTEHAIESSNLEYTGSTYTLSSVPVGTVIVEFFGSNIKLDDITGYSLTTAPAIALFEGETAVANGDTKDFGFLNANGTATYTLKNIGNAPLTATITGEGVTVEPASIELAAGETKDVTVTMAYAEPYGAKTGSITINSEDWVGAFVVNFTAELIDQTDFVEDFEGGKPDGWYSEWNYGQENGNGVAYIYTNNNKALITKKVYAENGKNELKFKAKTYSGETGTLAVYTTYDPEMIDRNKWNEPATTFNLTNEFQEFSLGKLSNGNYYLKFESANAVIDDVKGLGNDELPARDLYAAIPTITKEELTPGESLTSSIKVTNVRNEIATNGVYAKWWYRLDAEGTGFTQWGDATAAQDIDGNGNATFSITRDAPAEEGTYIWLVQVLYGNNDMAYESEHYQFTVAHTTSMSVTDFAVVTPTATADDDNKFTAEFNVTVQNTGSTSIAANDVSVSITDGSGNAYNDNATTWTLASSQTIFLTPGEYSNDGAVLALCSWNTSSEQTWTKFTETSITGFYSAELEGNTNFTIVRLKKSTDDGYDSSNGGLNWNNRYNNSIDYTLTDGNVYTFKDWSGDRQAFTTSTMATLAKGISTTLKVTLTTDAGEGGQFTFKAKENLSSTSYWSSKAVTVTAKPATVAATIGVAGYTTFASAYSLDLDNLSEGLTAYYVKADGVNSDAVKLTKATGKVKPGTGLVLKGNAGSYTIGTAEKTDAGIDGNLMVGCTTDTDVPQNAGYYVLANHEGEAQFQSLADHGLTIPAGKAYLDATSIVNGNARLTIVIDDDTTGIMSILREKGLDGDIYTLEGIRVENPKKGGLYIINGKKVVIK